MYEFTTDYRFGDIRKVCLKGPGREQPNGQGVTANTLSPLARKKTIA